MHESGMMREELGAIEARLNTARTMNAIEDDEDDCENNVSRFYEHDVSMLATEVKRLQSERDAAVADLEPHPDWSGCDSCMFDEYCGYAPDKSKCANCDEFSKWEWRGVKENGNRDVGTRVFSNPSRPYTPKKFIEADNDGS